MDPICDRNSTRENNNGALAARQSWARNRSPLTRNANAAPTTISVETSRKFHGSEKYLSDSKNGTPFESVYVNNRAVAISLGQENIFVPTKSVRGLFFLATEHELTQTWTRSS